MLWSEISISTLSSSRVAQLTHLQHFCGNFCILNHVTESTRVGHGRSRTTIDLLLAEDGAEGSFRVLPHSLSDHLPILATLAFEMPTVPVLRSSRNTRGQIRHCLTVRQVMLYYSALVIPDILYASNAFLPGQSAEQRNTVAELDKRCIHCVADEHPLAHTLPLYTRLGVCPVLERGECKLRHLTFRIRSEIGSELLSCRIVLQGPPTGMTTRDQLGRNLPLPWPTVLLTHADRF